MNDCNVSKWEWQNSNGSWVPHAKFVNEDINRKFHRSGAGFVDRRPHVSSVVDASDGHKYTVDVVEGIQVDESGIRRRVRSTLKGTVSRQMVSLWKRAKKVRDEEAYLDRRLG